MPGNVAWRADPTDATATGYASGQYAAALAEFGTPLELPRCGGWVLQRPIPGTHHRDAMGSYPVFACRDWSTLPDDIEALPAGLVSFALVTDPFGNWSEPILHRCFDRVLRFKDHFVYDLALPPERHVSWSHRRNARSALRHLRIEVATEAAAHLDEWTALYGALVVQRGITGIRAFSSGSFARQLRVPGITMLRAFHGHDVIAAQLWYANEDVAYSHLTTGGHAAYTLGAVDALYWSALQYFRGRARWLDLGGGAGITSDGRDGLSAFKRGWSTDSRPVFFCGRILDPPRYAQILREQHVPETAYFPAYRQGEFT
jgi:hypothetical protein